MFQSFTLHSLLSQRFMRPGAWACILLITILSLIPKEMEIRTGALPSLEHAFAYACTAAAFVLGYRQRVWWYIALALGAYSGLMELLQFFSPGRHPGFDGAAGSTLGAFVGAFSAARLLAQVR
jgi:VanZ family protein